MVPEDFKYVYKPKVVLKRVQKQGCIYLLRHTDQTLTPPPQKKSSSSCCKCVQVIKSGFNWTANQSSWKHLSVKRHRHGPIRFPA